jgi:cytochrome P450
MTRAVSADLIGPLPRFLTDGAGISVSQVCAPTGDQIWLVNDYQLGRAVLTDPRFSRAAAAAPGAPRFNTANPAPTSIMSMDGADHARLRRLVANAFTPRRVRELTPVVRQLADQQLDEMERAGPPADLIAMYAAPIPFAVVTALLGVPPEDRAVFGECVGVLFDVTATGERQKARRSFALYDYMSTLIDRKRREPGDDLLSALAQAQVAGALSRAELIDLGLALLTAGYETTVSQIGLCALAALLDPVATASGADFFHPAVIEELLRLTPSTPLSFPRVALEDIRLGDVVIEAGQAVVVSLLHANRDPGAFGDPEDIRVTDRLPHLTFGHGPHYCLGAQLARAQVGIAIDALFRRFPQARLARGDDAVVWTDGHAVRGLRRLMVEW